MGLLYESDEMSLRELPHCGHYWSLLLHGICLFETITDFCHHHRQFVSVCTGIKWGSGKCQWSLLHTECFPPVAVIVLATGAVHYCRGECEFAVAAFQVHRLCKDPSERSGQWSSDVVAIQECASGEREAAGCWGKNNNNDRLRLI